MLCTVFVARRPPDDSAPLRRAVACGRQRDAFLAQPCMHARSDLKLGELREDGSRGRPARAGRGPSRSGRVQSSISRRRRQGTARHGALSASAPPASAAETATAQARLSFPSNTRHTPQQQPFEVILRYPHHPLAGERLTVVRRLVNAGDAHFVVELSNRVRLLLPAWMTEVCAASSPMMAAPRLSLACLRELRLLVDQPDISSSPSHEAIRSGGGDDGATYPGMAI